MMAAGRTSSLEDLSDDPRRQAVRPWSSPWSLDDEWDDEPARPQPAPAVEQRKPVAKSPPQPQPQPQPQVKTPSAAAPVAKLTTPPQVVAVEPLKEPPLIIKSEAPPTAPAPKEPAPKESAPPAPVENKKPQPVPETPPAPQPAPQRRKIPPIEILRPTFSWVTPILLSLGLLGLTFLAWVYWHDVPLETDEDLRLSLPVDQTITVSAPKRMRAFLESIRPLREPSLSSQPPWLWPTPALSEHVVGNGAAFDNLRDLLEDYDWHPRHSTWHVSDIGSEPAWGQVSVLLQAQAAYLVRRGDEESAFTTAIDLAEFSRRLQEMWAWPSFAARSDELHTACVQTLAELLKRTRLGNDRLALFQKEFLDCQPSRAVLQDALTAYYIHEKKLLLGRQSGEPLDTMPYGLTQKRPGRLLFKINQTLNLFAGAFRELKGDLSAPPNAFYAGAGENVRRIRQTAPQFYQPNASGERYFSNRIDAYLDLPEQHNLAQARHELILCLFAIRRHVAEHQRLPADLAALKPDFLAQVPIDPFSGEPLHYEAAKGRVFSVGINRVAEGGIVTQPPMNDPKEPTVELGIAAAAVVK